ncbi:PREDICTED: loricrin-like, partial [Pterocles gutturalis]|uniref:loricrin-like n=1 Tax=Pterocles gutturalis TaxID=240206 RepID=UPI0005283C09
IYRYLRERCAQRNRGYSNEISSHRRGNHSNLHGHGSFFCSGEGSIIYSRDASSWQPMSTLSTYNAAGRYRCDGDGSVVITSGNSGGTSGWGAAGGTVPVYGRNPFVSSGGGGGSTCHSERLGIAGGGGSGSGYSSRGLGYGIGGYSSPELSYGGGGCSQAIQQKCPVVIPNIDTQQSKRA